MPTNFTTVSGTNIQDLSGTKLPAGRIYFKPVDVHGNPISFRAGGGGQVISRAKSAVVTNGAFTIVLADVSLTNPSYVGYKVTVKDTSTGETVLGLAPYGTKSGYEYFQPTGSTYDFDTFVPNSIGTAMTVVPGPTGPAGAAGGSGEVNTVTDASIPSGNSSGSGSSANAAFATAISTYPGQTLSIPSGSVHNITADLTISNPVTVGGAGGFYVASGKVLTLKKPNIGFVQAFWGPGTVKVLGSEILPQWYGAVGDGTTDDAPAIQRAVTQNPGATIRFRHTTSYYRCASSITVDSFNMKFKGGAGAYMGTGGVQIKFDTTVPGFIIANSVTQGTGFVGLRITGGDQWAQNNAATYILPAGFGGTNAADGLRVYGHGINVFDCYFENWGRDGIRVDTQNYSGNSNCNYMMMVRIVNCRGNGMYAVGADSNAGKYTLIDATANQLWGICDDSFLGNTWDSCHVDLNHYDLTATGSSATINTSARSANTETIGTSSAHGFVFGDVVAQAGTTSNLFTRGSNQIVSVPTTATYTACYVGADKASGADTGTAAKTTASGNWNQSLTNVATSGSTVTWTGGSFGPQHLAQPIYIPGAGAAGADYYGYISAQSSATVVTVSPATSTVVSGVTAKIAVDGGAYKCVRAATSASFPGCYSESGQPASKMSANVKVDGGAHGADFDYGPSIAANNRWVTSNWLNSGGLRVDNPNTGQNLTNVFRHFGAVSTLFQFYERVNGTDTEQYRLTVSDSSLILKDQRGLCALNLFKTGIAQLDAGGSQPLRLNWFSGSGLSVGAGGSASVFDIDSAGKTTAKGDIVLSGASGELWTRGKATELLTLSTSGTTTDTSANLLPANSIIEAVVARVTTGIGTATNWKLGDPTTSGRFSAPNSTMTAGTTQVGLVHADQTGAAGPIQTSAAKVRVTTTGTPSAGAIRITVFYRTFTPPTS